MSEEILIAGGTGLIGANLTLKLREMGLPTVSTRFSNTGKNFPESTAVFDFRLFDDCLAATREKKAVVLCAALSHGAKENRDNPTGTILPNLQITAGLLEASARNKVRTVVMLSSSTVYQPAGHPIREDQLDLNLAPFQGYFGVGWTNRYMERLAALYADTYRMRIVVLRPTSVYGPFDKFDDERSHVVPALIKRALNREDPFEVWGSPNVVRDFIYVGDVVDDIVFALMNDSIPEADPINLCSGRPLTIKETVDAILMVCRHAPKVFFNEDQPSAVPYRAVDDTKYRSLFGKKERTPFDVGLAKTVEWYSHKLSGE